VIVTPGGGGVGFSLFEEQAVQAIVNRNNVHNGDREFGPSVTTAPPKFQDFATLPRVFPYLKTASTTPSRFPEVYFFRFSASAFSQLTRNEAGMLISDLSTTVSSRVQGISPSVG
jgi:hypothetical protein